MPWWGWITVGTLLLAAEISFVDLEFYLVFLGISALLVGMFELAGVAMPFWMQWLVFAIFALGSLLIFRQRVYSKLRPQSGEEIQVGVVGDVATAVDEIAPGARGAVKLRGSSWTGTNRGTETIPAGSRCRVERSEGLVLDVHLDT